MTTDRPAEETVSGPPGGDATEAAGHRQVPMGGALQGRAAELLAAVRAVESGERSAASFFTAPVPAPGDGGCPGPAGGSGRAGASAASKVSGPVQPPVSGPVRPPVGSSQAASSPAGHPGGPAGGPGDGSAKGRGAGPATAVGGDRPEREAVRRVLDDGGAPEALVLQVITALGEHAAQLLRKDPWQLLAVPGVRPEQADAFARALLGPECGPGDERRAQALVGWLLARAAREGHTVLESSTLAADLARHAVPDPHEAMRTAITRGSVLVFQDPPDPPGTAQASSGDESADPEHPVRVLLGLDRHALAEESLADGLARLRDTFASCAQDGTSAGGTGSGTDWESAAAGVPSSAAELVGTAATSGLVAHTGGEAARAEPAAVIGAARSIGLRAYAATHSADGRRRLAEQLGEAAVTVSGLLAGHEGPGRDQDGWLALDVLALLDAPQLDVETAALLVESLPDGTRLILSGDPGTLGSAGPGRVFADLLAARACPQVASRTPDPGPIGELVSGIGIGELNQVQAPGKEVVVVPVRNAGEAVHRTVQLVTDSVPRAIGVPPDHTQVITPVHGGSAGTRVLNAALKERLNPGPGTFGGFDVGDRVVYVPAPGRTLPGTVVSADTDGLRVDCGESAAVIIPRQQVAGTVRHGWALTAHQAAGMRWPAAVVVLPGDAAPTLTRAWVYTAFSRAEQHLSVVHGADQALARAVAEVPVKERTTRLRTLLQTLAPPTG